MVKTFFQMSFPNELNNQRKKVKSILQLLTNEVPELNDDDLYDLRLIYNELIANAMIHGNRCDLAKKVELFIEIDTNIIKSAVKDEGFGFDYSQLFKKKEPQYEVLLEHGRGLKLVLSLVDYVKWNDIGNEIIFYKQLIAK